MIVRVAPRARAAAVPSATTWKSPADGARVGGDWAEVVSISEHLVAFTVGDVFGHGDHVAATMEIVRSSVLRALCSTQVPSEVLSVANHVASSCGGEVLVSAIVATLDYRENRLTFANAGHPPPLLLSEGHHGFLERPSAGLPLGAFPAYASANGEVKLPPHALLVLYTDGITEHNRDTARGEEELIEAARFVFARREPNVARAICRRVLEKGRGYDDVAALAVRTAPAIS
jgi:serine phosphatase RsbU (regulator of sigma subunit)